MRTLVRLIAVTTAVVTAAVLGAGAASAEPTTGELASFRGGKIDLSKGWGDAKACLVFSRTDVRCYGSYEEADAAAAVAGPENVDRTSGDVGISGLDDVCYDGWLCLFEDWRFEGRKLQFSDGYWHDLSTYDFRNKTSSWANNQDCNWYNDGTDHGYISDRAGGGNDGWVLRLDACSMSSSLSPYYNDKADDVMG